jgi:hypothetical protein
MSWFTHVPNESILASIHRKVDYLDEILLPYKTMMDQDYEPYRNHCYRVYNLAALLTFPEIPPSPEDLKKLAIAIAFHDIGIWTAHTTDYIDPSVEEALKYCKTINLPSEEADLIAEMIDNHHMFSVYDGHPLVEGLRKADWIDATMGMRTFGYPNDAIKTIRNEFEVLGFYDLLVKLTMGAVWKSPFSNPVPIYQWSPRFYVGGKKNIGVPVEEKK